MLLAEASPKYKWTLASVNFVSLNLNEARNGFLSNLLKDCATPGSLTCLNSLGSNGDLADLLADFDSFLSVVEIHYALVVPAVSVKEAAIAATASRSARLLLVS